ncbi:MAG TPA: hypothetical protein VF525_17690 [Pyrinomonadaceae bacterium]|jgi:tetratricopeptide (TPR) repeat protein
MYEFLQRVNPSAAQDYGVGGRISWAIYCHDVGKVAMEEGDLVRALAVLSEGVHAFPFPLTLAKLGECLLLEGRPVEAVVYLAAAVGMSEEYQFHQLFLLGKALAAANDNYASKIMLTKALLIEPDQEAQELLNAVIKRAEDKD